MKTFLKWVEKRILDEELEDMMRPADGFKLNNNDDLGSDYDHTLQELMKVMMSKYQRETMEFLNGISQRGDEEVINLLRKLGKVEKPVDMSPPHHPSEKDEVVPPEADSGHSDSNGG